ncbi:hypothetical protein IWX90DRAFT_134213 [Phyllosticta citrichinensis]|uniref:Uncharacterized protein n=1 Tax=Phyllosticta citrichinensis TaxID=1130410 RepID=A0ABR1Y541_9PEZI
MRDSKGEERPCYKQKVRGAFGTSSTPCKTFTMAETDDSVDDPPETDDHVDDPPEQPTNLVNDPLEPRNDPVNAPRRPSAGDDTESEDQSSDSDSSISTGSTHYPIVWDHLRFVFRFKNDAEDFPMPSPTVFFCHDDDCPESAVESVARARLSNTLSKTLPRLPREHDESLGEDLVLGIRFDKTKRLFRAEVFEEQKNALGMQQ